jgi:hypothetical protein
LTNFNQIAVCQPPGRHADSVRYRSPVFRLQESCDLGRADVAPESRSIAGQIEDRFLDHDIES